MYIVFDIGGTNTRFARSDDGVTLKESLVVKTPETFEAAIDMFKHAIEQLATGDTMQGIAGGIRGVLHHDKTELISESILTSWVGKPLRTLLATVGDIPVFFENDAALAALGEANHGAGKNYTIVAYLTVSTGVGGARVVSKTLDPSSVGFEPGKQIIDPDKTLCPDCPGNTLEDYVSGRGLEHRFGKQPREINDEHVWEELARFLALGVYNLETMWSPDVVVIGGPMVLGSPAISVATVERYTHELGGSRAVPIVQAELGDQSGLYGALAYLQQKNL